MLPFPCSHMHVTLSAALQSGESAEYCDHTQLRRLSRRRLLGRSGQVSLQGRRSACTLAAGGTRRGAGSLARRRGPVVGTGLSSSESLSAFPVRRDSRRGAPEPLRRLRRIRSCGRVPLTSVVRLIRASSGALRRRASHRRFSSRQLTRAPSSASPFASPRHVARLVGVSLRRLRHGRTGGPRFLGAPIRLPGVPLWSRWGPGAPSAPAAHPVFRPGPAHFGSSADPSALPVLAHAACPF